MVLYYPLAFCICSGLFGNSAGSDNGEDEEAAIERDERQQNFDVLSPQANHKDICGRRFVRQSRIVGGGVASYGEWPWQVRSVVLFIIYNSIAFMTQCGNLRIFLPLQILRELWQILRFNFRF